LFVFLRFFSLRNDSRFCPDLHLSLFMKYNRQTPLSLTSLRRNDTSVRQAGRDMLDTDVCVSMLGFKKNCENFSGLC